MRVTDIDQDRRLVPAAAPDEAPIPARVRIAGLRKQFRREDGTLVSAVDGVDLDIHAGEFVALLGPSGCGKTTLLRCVAGLERPDEGEISMGERRVFSRSERVHVRPEHRGISMVFQSYALWPHMSALANVAYPLRSRGIKRNAARDRAAAALESVGIGHLGRQMPNGMSGGQQQRVALARALVTEADVILFDEPLSNVDAKVREELRVELVAMQRKIGFSAVYVTHDQSEAMEVAHRVVVMSEGRIMQAGAPAEIYESPASWHVARFIGTVNDLCGSVTAVRSGRVCVRTELGDVWASPSPDAGNVGQQVAIVARPEHFALALRAAAGDDRSENSWSGQVETAMFSGAHVEYLVRVGETAVRVWQAGSRPIPEGSPVAISLPDSVRCLPKP